MDPKSGGLENAKGDVGQCKRGQRFDFNWQDKQKHDSAIFKRQNVIENCKYCGTGHPLDSILQST